MHKMQGLVRSSDTNNVPCVVPLRFKSGMEGTYVHHGHSVTEYGGNNQTESRMQVIESMGLGGDGVFVKQNIMGGC
jgi:hypothetical protein